MFSTLINDNLGVVSNVIPSPTCEYIITHFEDTHNFRDCTMNKVINKDYRDSHEVHIKDHNMARMVWKFVKPHVPATYQGRNLVGAHYKTFYLLRYGPGQKFHTHRDGHSTNSKGQKSFLTALIYLNCDYKGGQTRFYAEPNHGIELNTITGSDDKGMYYDAEPTEGAMVLMRHYILHSAQPVQEGVKYALRFNILYESFGEWYNGPESAKKFEGVGANCGIDVYNKAPYQHDIDPIRAAWEQYNAESVKQGRAPDVYTFLPGPKQPRGRPPIIGEGFCNNCYEILDLTYDYYICPRCLAPVIHTKR